MADLIWTSKVRRAIGCRPDRSGACNDGHDAERAPPPRRDRAAARCARRSRPARAHGRRRSAELCGALDALRGDRQEQPGHSRRYVGAVRALPRALLRLSQAPAAGDGRGARLVQRLSHRRLGLLPAGDGECRFCAVDRVVGLALLTLVPFFNFHGLKFNVNTILLPLWAATTLWFLRSFETRRVFDAALAGLFAAAAMYGKYWSIVLLIGLVIAALIDRRRATYFSSPVPWVTIAVGALALAPHLAWLIGSGFAPFSYAVTLHGEGSFESTLAASLGYLAGSIAYVALPLLLVLLMARPSGAAVKDMAWPPAPQRRLAAAAFWAVLLTPAAIAPLAGVRLVSLWSMSAFTLLPVMLLSSPLVALARRDAVRVLTVAVALPVVMVAAAPAVAFVIHRAGPPPGSVHASVLAEPIERLWRETTDAPLRFFGGFDEFTDGVTFYMRSHPLAVHVLDSTV